MTGRTLDRQRLGLSVVVALALAGCGLGLVAPPSVGPQDTGEQVLDLVRIVCTTALALSLLLGPGVAWRALGPPDRPLSLGFLALPGLAMMILGGCLAWALADIVHPRVVSFALFTPVLCFFLATLLFARPRELFTREERHVLLVVGCVLGLAIGRTLWSLGPEGELYGGTISRTLEVGDRSDSRISFHVVQLVATGEGPYSRFATALLHPYNFSSRGPLAGIAASPVVLLAGGRPPSAGRPDEPWLPFDPEGFMAYRLAMMSFAAIAFLALWDLVRRLAGRTGAYFAVLLAATTPFLVHEVWFTWPKMLAAAMVLLAAIWVIERRPLQAGLLFGFGYLMHPGVLLAAPTLGLIALWPLLGAHWKRPRIRQGVLLAAGLAVALIAWRVINGRHYDQSGFLDYFLRAGPNGPPGLGTAWVVSRLASLGNTLVPMLLPLAGAQDPSINVVNGSSPPVIHFFFQYWNTLPFGFAIIFLPLLVVGLWRAGRRWPWPVLATVLVPFAFFTIYWGAATSGMMREGLQAWALTLCAVIACEQAASGFGWLRSTPIRIVLALRVVEVLAMAIVPTVATRHELISAGFGLTDAVAFASMLGFGAALGALVWKAAPPPRAVDAGQGARPGRGEDASPPLDARIVPPMTASVGSSTREPTIEIGLNARQRLLLALILTGQFMAVLDASIVNVALPTIRRDLHATGAELQLIVASYVIAYAVLLITGARLGQRFGFRPTFIWGLAIFTGASLACGLAPDSQTLIVVRAIQGAGAALMVPQVFSLIQRNFAGSARAQALSLWAATLALGGVVGQVLGGLLVTADLFGTGWRPVFLVNVPIGLLLLVASIRLLPIDVPAPARSLDLGGLISLAAAVLLLVVPLVLGNEEGWPAWAIASLALSGVAIVVFALIERYVERRGGAPLIAGRVLRAPGMPAALVAIVLALASYGGFLFTFTQHLQLGLRDSPLQAGLTFVPMALGFALASLNWRRLPVAWHQLVIPAGCIIAVVGYSLTAIAASSGGDGGILLPIALFVAGFGQGMAASPILTVALSKVAPQDAADASGVITTVIQLGLVLGVATFGSVFLNQAALPGAQPTVSAITLTLALIVIALLGCAVASTAMVRAQRSAAVAFGDVVQDAGRTA